MPDNRLLDNRENARQVYRENTRQGTQAMNTEMLVRLAKAYGAHKGLTIATVSTYAANDGKLFRRMSEDGAGCTLRTAQRVVSWFSGNWPDDLEWPSDIPRPPKSTEAA